MTHRQLLALGCTRRVIDGLLERGHLLPVQRGVYAVGHRLRTHAAVRWAGVLACGPEAAASHGTAAPCTGCCAPATGST